MIEVNLLPGAKRGKRGAGVGVPSLNFAAIGAAISARVKDKFLAAAVVSTVIALGAIAFLYLTQQTRANQLSARVTKAVADSAKYAAVLQERARLEARRDSALLQLNIIHAIDDERFVWPHVLSEISRALPPYTWLTSLTFTGTPAGTNPAAAVQMAAPDTGKAAKGKKKKSRVPDLPRDTVKARLTGRTVDIQAFTRFWRSLEDSPFLGNVQLQRSEQIVEGGKDVTQFIMELMYKPPDTTVIKRAPLSTTSR